MEIKFYKYQGTGNDFVILDNRKGEYSKLSREQIKRLCDRHFGVGADGLMLLNEKKGYDFEMIYFNADGRPGSMCGNGGRCMVKLTYYLGLQKSNYNFLAVDGAHEARLDDDGIVALKMQNVDSIELYHTDFILDTGSSHYVKKVPDVMHLDVVKRGREIRYSKEFEKKGINVNFVERLSDIDKIIVRTYERGVENETRSCGTGVTAAALVCYHNENGFNEVEVQTPGGWLNVEFDRIENNKYVNIWLCGPAEKVFEGTISI